MRALAEAGEPEGSWLRADRQTGGKGRRGRTWISPQGNLHASTLVRLRETDPPAPTLALVAAVALHDTVATHLRHSGESRNPEPQAPHFVTLDSGLRRNDEEGDIPTLLIKWPNDLLLDGRKLAGILLERADDAVIIGFGVNIAHAPEGLNQPATCLAAYATVPSPEVFLAALTEIYESWLATWRGQSLAELRAAWLIAAHPIGTPLSTPDGDGTFDGLDDNGSLRLRVTDGSIRVLHAGDVALA